MKAIPIDQMMKNKIIKIIITIIFTLYWIHKVNFILKLLSLIAIHLKIMRIIIFK